MTNRIWRKWQCVTLKMTSYGHHSSPVKRLVWKGLNPLANSGHCLLALGKSQFGSGSSSPKQLFRCLLLQLTSAHNLTIDCWPEPLSQATPEFLTTDKVRNNKWLLFKPQIWGHSFNAPLNNYIGLWCTWHCSLCWGIAIIKAKGLLSLSLCSTLWEEVETI